MKQPIVCPTCGTPVVSILGMDVAHGHFLTHISPERCDKEMTGIWPADLDGAEHGFVLTLRCNQEHYWRVIWAFMEKEAAMSWYPIDMSRGKKERPRRAAFPKRRPHVMRGL